MATVILMLAGAVTALIWRMKKDDDRADQLIAATQTLAEMKAAWSLSEHGRQVAEDGVVELAGELERQRANATAVAAALEARLKVARERLRKYVPADELANALNDILTPRAS